MGEGILVDTDILIEYYKNLYQLPKQPLYISIITMYEFTRGTRDPKTAKKLLDESFPILWLDNEIILKRGEIWQLLRREGELIDDRDLIIGATAIINELELLTENEKHFKKLEKYGLKLYGG